MKTLGVGEPGGGEMEQIIVETGVGEMGCTTFRRKSFRRYDF